MQDDPKGRFTERVDDYRRARPGYPAALMEELERSAGLGAGAVVADLGSGTGIFAEMLLERGAVVHGVEPNRAMARAASAELLANPRFHDRDGSAESTGLDEASVDLVTAAQAFHWFRPEETAAECRRILRPGAPAAIVWNLRLADDDFDRAYEQLLQKWGEGYREVQARHGEAGSLRRFFGRDVEARRFPHEQCLDAAGLEARLLSCSYVPRPSDPASSPMLEELRGLFAQHQSGGTVRFHYEAVCFLSSLD